jgi:hypothetical protein
LVDANSETAKILENKVQAMMKEMMARWRNGHAIGL